MTGCCSPSFQEFSGGGYRTISVTFNLLSLKFGPLQGPDLLPLKFCSSDLHSTSQECPSLTIQACVYYLHFSLFSAHLLTCNIKPIPSDFYRMIVVSSFSEFPGHLFSICGGQRTRTIPIFPELTFLTWVTKKWQ